MKKVESFKIFSDEIPENMGTVRKKILFLLHKHGMIERAPFMIDGVTLTTIRFIVIGMLKSELIQNVNGFISLTENGLKLYSEQLKIEIQATVSLQRVIKEINKSTNRIGAKKITINIFGKDYNKQHIYRVRLALKKLINDGIIVVHSIRITEKFYVLADSVSGKKIIKDQAEYKEEESLSYLFQTILTGDLTGGLEKKPYLY